MNAGSSPEGSSRGLYEWVITLSFRRITKRYRRFDRTVECALKDLALAGESDRPYFTEPIFVERGHIGSHDTGTPIETNRFRARLFWMGDRPLSIGKRYKVKLLLRRSSANWSRSIA